MPSLLDQSGGDPTGIYSLLGPALSGGVAQDPQSSQAAFLAAATAMANAGAPTLGPPPTTAQAILGALGAGRQAAVQQEIIPYVAQQAGQAAQMRQLDYDIKSFNFQRQLNYQKMLQQGTAADASGAPPAPAPGSAAAGGPPPAGGAGSTDIASLPDVQALPDQSRAPAIQVMTSLGMSPDEAAQYARMLMQESAGQHLDKDGNVIMNTKGSGATGVAQVMPGTFDTMAKLHGIDGKITDLIPNLTAGANYFHDQVVANGGDLRNAAIAYSMGPDGLKRVLGGQPLPSETSDYLVKTRAPGPAAATAVAGSGSGPAGPALAYPPTAPASDMSGLPPSVRAAIGPNADPLVADPVTGEMIPRSTYLNRAALVAGAPSARPAGTQFAGPGAPSSAPAAAPPAASATDPLVRDPVTGAMVPRSILQGAFAAGGTATDNGPAAHAAFINDYLQKRALMPQYVPGRAPGTQVDVTHGQVVASPPGTGAVRPLTPADRQALFPGGMDKPVLGVYDPNGTLTDLKYPEVPEPLLPVPDTVAKLPIEQGGVGDAYRTGTAYQRGAWTNKITPVPIERGAGPPAPDQSGVTVLTPGQMAQQDSLRASAQKDPRIANFGQQLTYVGRMNNLAADSTRTASDDIAALNTWSKFNDPSAVVHQSGEDAILTTGGPDQRVQTVISHLVGGRFLTADTMQHIIDTVNTEAEGARAGFTVASNTYRTMAQRAGLNPDQVTPDPEQQIQDYQKAWTASQTRLRGGAGVGGQTAVPGAAPTVRSGTAPPPPAPPAAPAPGQPMPVPAAATLQNMTKQGFRNLAADMQAHPERYSPEYQAAIKAELQNRVRGAGALP